MSYLTLRNLLAIRTFKVFGEKRAARAPVLFVT